MFENLNNPGSIGDSSNGAGIVAAVRARVCEYFEQPTPEEANLTFLGAQPLTLLRFGAPSSAATAARAPIITYVTLGCSAEPMHDPTSVTTTSDGPRAELALPVRGGLDAVIRPLAMLAAAPTVEGLVLQDGAIVDFSSPLWESAPFTGFVLIDADIPDVVTRSAPMDTETVVKMLQPVPVTTNELALARAKGVAELVETWRRLGCDFADVRRASAV